MPKPIDKAFYDDTIELSIEAIEALLKHEYHISKRAIALLLLQEDAEIKALIRQDESGDIADKVDAIINQTKAKYAHPLSYVITMRRQEETNAILTKAVSQAQAVRMRPLERLSRIMINPITGLPILALILYFGLYKFVGDFGAGVLVDFLESTVFEGHVNPFMIKLFQGIIPWKPIQDLIVGEYGVITLGVRYAVALIFPIVAVFFLAFSIIEDTGYLPRLALLIDNIFKKIGLTGRAVIPMVLGFGCDTMATMVTRTLPTKRERIIATLLLALAIPCSAQLGVIFALLEGRPKALMIWALVVTLVFLLIGFLSAKIMPGERPSFYMEIPPLRWPKPSNVFVKTYTRVHWYFTEIFPMFILASVLIWIGQITGVFDLLVKWLAYPVRAIGLPDKAAIAFLFGFFRRDYGVAGLYDMKEAGLLTGVQLVVSTVTLTLFLPCVAQLLMNIKERGMKLGIGLSLFILFFSFSVGYVVNLVLTLFNVAL